MRHIINSEDNINEDRRALLFLLIVKYYYVVYKLKIYFECLRIWENNNNMYLIEPMSANKQYYFIISDCYTISVREIVV
jgi:hypothetical protein